jgi:hypothetical protein
MRPLRLLGASAGFIVWSSAVVLLYAGLSLGCEAGLQTRPLAWTNVLTVLLAGIWIVHLAALIGLQWYSLALWHRDFVTENTPDTARFLGGITCLITAAALISTFVVGFPLLMLPPCSRIPLWM